MITARIDKIYRADGTPASANFRLASFAQRLGDEPFFALLPPVNGGGYLEAPDDDLYSFRRA